MLLYAALGGALFFLPLNLIQVHGYSAAGAAAAAIPFVLTVSILGRWAGGLVDKVGARLPLALGPAIVALGFALLTLPGTDGPYWRTFFLPLLLLGLGMAINIAPLATVVMAAVPDHYAGTASGINNAASRVAGLLSVALLSIVMVSGFTAALRDALHNGLEDVTLTAPERDAILAQTPALVNIDLPDSLSDESQAKLRAVIRRAFVTGFRQVTWIATVLAVASAIVGWSTVPARAKT
jgi:MFS family permease